MEIINKGFEALVPSVALADACAHTVALRVITAPVAAAFPREKSALSLMAGAGLVPSGNYGKTLTNTQHQSKSAKRDGFSGVPPRGRPV